MPLYDKNIVPRRYKNLGFWSGVDVPPSGTLLIVRRWLVQRHFLCLELACHERDLWEWIGI